MMRVSAVKVNKVLEVVYKNPKNVQQDRNYRTPEPVLRDMATTLNNSSPDTSEGWDHVFTAGRQPTRDEIYADVGKSDVISEKIR